MKGYAVPRKPDQTYEFYKIANCGRHQRTINLLVGKNVKLFFRSKCAGDNTPACGKKVPDCERFVTDFFSGSVATEISIVADGSEDLKDPTTIKECFQRERRTSHIVLTVLSLVLTFLFFPFSLVLSLKVKTI